MRSGTGSPGEVSNSRDEKNARRVETCLSGGEDVISAGGTGPELWDKG